MFNLLIIGVILATSPAFAGTREYAAFVRDDGSLISTDREATVVTGQQLLEQTYQESREGLEGLVYKIDIDASLLTIQDASGITTRKIPIQPETVFTGAGSMQDLNINDRVYLVYYHDISGQIITTNVYLIARESEGNPYTASGPKREEFISRLISSLSVPEEYIRAYAVSGLGNFNDPAAVSELTYVLRHEKSSFVRINAIKSLAKLKDPSSAPDLVAALYIEDKIENYQVTRALVEIGKPAIDALIEGLYNTDKNVRRACAQTLGEIENGSMSSSATQTSAAFEPLVAALNDSNVLVRQAAEDSLKAMTGQDLGKKPDVWRVWFNERQTQE